MANIQFGYILPTESLQRVEMERYTSTIHRALEMISGTFDSAWTIDHLEDGPSPMMEGFTTITYLAGMHPQLRFGNTVISQVFRSPALLAKMAATLQFLSGGRFILGIGAGGQEAESRAYGYDFPSGAVRVEQLEETLQIIRAMWTEEQATFPGKHYRVDGAYCVPKPDPLPPVTLGAFGPRMLRLTARYADWWNPSSSGLDKYRRMSEELDRACQEIGRDPASIRRMWSGGIAIARTREKAEKFAAVRISQDEDDYGFIGTPEQVVEQMRRYIDLGVDCFLLGCEGFPDLEPLELLVNEVLPVLNAE